MAFSSFYRVANVGRSVNKPNSLSYPELTRLPSILLSRHTSPSAQTYVHQHQHQSRNSVHIVITNNETELTRLKHSTLPIFFKRLLPIWLNYNTMIYLYCARILIIERVYDNFTGHNQRSFYWLAHEIMNKWRISKCWVNWSSGYRWKWMRALLISK
jgi:hypothetical protein